MQAGLPSFVLSTSEWIERTHAVGIMVKKGRYGGTYAYKDIAFEFGTAISVPFKLYLIEEFQRLKEQEQAQIGWNAKRLYAASIAACPSISPGASSAITHLWVFWQARQPVQKCSSFPFNVIVSTSLPASAAPLAKASASASELLLRRRLDDITSIFFMLQR